MCKDPLKRLGSDKKGGVSRIKKHPFFKKVCWEQVVEKKMKPPHIPQDKKGAFCGDQMNICNIIKDNFESTCISSDVKEVFKKLTEKKENDQEDEDCISNFSYEDKKSSDSAESLEFDGIPEMKREYIDLETPFECADPYYVPQKPSPRVEVKSLFTEKEY